MSCFPEVREHFEREISSPPTINIQEIHPPKQTWNLKMDPWKGDSYWKSSVSGSSC